MYSEKLKNAKIAKDNGEAFVGIEIGKKEVFRMIDEFCTEEDILNVPVTKVFELFYEFCEEKGYPKINNLTLGRIFRERFNLTRKMVRNGQKLFYVYVKNTGEK